MEVKAKQTKIKYQAHYHYNETISLKNFESKFSKINRKQALIKRIDNYQRICSVIAPFYQIVSFASGYINEERGENIYLKKKFFFLLKTRVTKKIHGVLGCS